MKIERILVIWGNWGPYHYARFRALHEHAREKGIDARGIELFPSSGVYQWESPLGHEAVHHFKMGERETEFHPVRLSREIIPFLQRFSPDVVFVPSYWHWSLFINVAARLAGARIVMMNESHAGTEKATGLKRGIKRAIVRSFHGGLVGGSPHERYFSKLGLRDSTIFPGYDAIDNRYFDTRSREVRRNAEEVRGRFGLPERYFLSLGRMIPKKNLPVLVRAYSLFLKRSPSASHHLVFVGSGETESHLRGLCKDLGLDVQVHPREEHDAPPPPSRPTVHFLGFRQIEENPVFYALASAFVLPSVHEEWGLVVNEAMACSLPVAVSRSVGAAEDLVTDGETGFLFNPNSPEELADCLERLADDTASANMGRQAWRRIQRWGCETFACNALKSAEAASGISITHETPPLRSIP